MTGGCPSWCVRHTNAPGGTAHHSEMRRLSEDGYVLVWVFRLPTGEVRIGIDRLTLPAPDQYRDDAADLASLLAQLGHPELAAAITAAAELAGTS